MLLICNGTHSKKALLSDPQLFDAKFEELVTELTERDLRDPGLADALNRLREVLNYNVPGGKKNRGLSVIGSLRELLPASQLTQDAVQRALTVGWCIEMLQAFFLMADDIMDASVTRRGQPCWYKRDGIGLDAINDSFLVESSIYRLLRRQCRDQPYYVHLLELFNETTFQTEFGQTLDLLTAPPGQIDLNRFTLERYKAIVKYKTAFYSFYLPVASAMYMVSVLDDFLDCYGDPAVTGKIGTDIQDNKCSWLVVKALQVMTPEQRSVLEVIFVLERFHFSKNHLKDLIKMVQVYLTVLQHRQITICFLVWVSPPTKEKVFFEGEPGQCLLQALIRQFLYISFFPVR
uniref:Farnesyl pyrophosphate synthase n=1 Tax=Fundulus heteroclitus TaxID=8078 RepID=A0A3Q2TRL0_FUNHE